MAALDRDFTPLTDMRAGQAYRRKVSRNLLYRFFLQTAQGEGEAPTDESAQVYAYGR